jgi:hypothetical protein
MALSSNIDFVKHFVESHEFFSVNGKLYMIYNDEVTSFDSSKARRLVSVEYQDLVNKLAPSGGYLLDNIESRVMLSSINTYDSLNVRVMNTNKAIVYDLIKDNKAVEVTNEGYEVVDKLYSGYKNLLATDSSLPQVIPESATANLIDLLSQVTNFKTKEDLTLFTV